MTETGGDAPIVAAPGRVRRALLAVVGALGILAAWSSAIPWIAFVGLSCAVLVGVALAWRGRSARWRLRILPEGRFLMRCGPDERIENVPEALFCAPFFVSFRLRDARGRGRTFTAFSDELDPDALRRLLARLRLGGSDGPGARSGIG
ncbi:MAG: hypothetical protein R3323_04150 [Wenzhouxiangellaceae bacterium]|nr:hypothetical protein [Wenzhouxiangellaceae bacterium]